MRDFLPFSDICLIIKDTDASTISSSSSDALIYDSMEEHDDLDEDEGVPEAGNGLDVGGDNRHHHHGDLPPPPVA